MNALGSENQQIALRHVGKNFFSDTDEKFKKNVQHHSEEETASNGWLMKYSKTLQRTTHASLFHSVILEVLLVIVGIAMTIIIWFFALKHAEHSVSIVSDALRGELLSHAKAFTTSVFEENCESAIHLAHLIASSLIKDNLSSFSTLENQMKPALFQGYSTIPYTAQVFYMGKNGLFVSYYTDFNETLILYANRTYTDSSMTHAGDPASYRQRYLWYCQKASATTGLPLGEAIPTGTFSFWGTKWFRDALNSKNGFATWGLAFGQSKELLFLSLASIKDVSPADPSGVLALGTPMRILMDFITHFDLLGGDMYLATIDGYLLAQTGGAFHVGGEIDKPILLEATKSGNPVVAGAALHLINKLKNISRLGNETFSSSDARIQGASYIVDSTPIHLAGTTMVCVVIIPCKSIWGHMEKQGHTTLILLIILAACMLFISCAFIFLLTRAGNREMHLSAALIQQLDATKQAERKNNQKNIAFARMSHDLRTSLAAIIGLIDLCHYDVVEGSELEMNLLQMNSCANNLLGLLNSILDVSKIEAEKLQLDETDFNIVQVLEEVVDMFSVVALEKGVEVVLDLCDDSAEKISWIKGDAGRLKQILCNLLSNGVKFTSEGHVILRAWVKQVFHSKPSVHGGHSAQHFRACWSCMPKWVFEVSNAYKQLDAFSEVQTDSNYVEFEFEVEDTGKGIPKDKHKSVFENFVQIDGLTSTNHDGIGLGLGIVRSLVHLMGGNIKIVDKGEPGEKGTCFRFNLFFRIAEVSVDQSKNGENRSLGMHVLNGVSLWAKSYSCEKYDVQDWQLRQKSSLTSGTSEPHWQRPALKENVFVVLAMNGEASKMILKKWLEHRCEQVLMVNQWLDFIPTLENLKQEVLVQSLRASETSEFVSPKSLLSDPWVDDMSHQGDTFSDYGVNQLSPDGYGSGTEESKQRKVNGVSMHLLVVVDINMIVGPPEQISAILSNFFGVGQVPICKVVWLANANTPSVELENLKRGSVPCDLILHKPVHGSRLHAVWDLVQDLSGKRTQQASEIEASNVLPQTESSDEHFRRKSFDRPTSSLVNFKDQKQMWSELTQKDNKLRAQNLLEGMHILVAEDNAVLRRLAQATLTQLGATVKCVDDGEQAVQIVSEMLHSRIKNNKDFLSSKQCPLKSSDDPVQPYVFDILLMDCEMPIMDGYEATRRIREEEKRYGFHIPIIALTAHAMAEEARRCIQAGMDFHLPKPLTREPLLNIVGKICAEKEALEL
ncbi:hypothetical protein SUGI_0859670 [Cryptomeria japonica]|nr:hypothetical protein SUGI_0859670 [Cryptomeria japonica]